MVVLIEVNVKTVWAPEFKIEVLPLVIFEGADHQPWRTDSLSAGVVSPWRTRVYFLFWTVRCLFDMGGSEGAPGLEDLLKMFCWATTHIAPVRLRES